MCMPNDPDELARIELMGKTMDALFDTLFKPKSHSPDICKGCGIDIRKYGRCSMCADARMENNRNHYHD